MLFYVVFKEKIRAKAYLAVHICYTVFGVNGLDAQVVYKEI